MSGFSGGSPDFYTANGYTGRSMGMNNPQGSYPISSASQILHRRHELIGKRSLAEFQSHQQQQQLGLYLRNVKPRTYQHASPISPLSPVDISASISPNVSSISSILQQLRPQPIIPPSLLPNRFIKQEQSEKTMMNRLQELEKQLLDDNDDDEADTVSVITNSAWSETIQSLISPSPTSSSSSASVSAPPICPKQTVIEVASAISEGKTEAASEILSRLNQVANVRGNSEQRLSAYMLFALRSKLNPLQYSPPVSELYSKEHASSTQLLYEASPCFKLGFMAANLAILEATTNAEKKLHVVDFEIGQGDQYIHLIHALSKKTSTPPFLKITTFADFYGGGEEEERLRSVGDGLIALANKVGVCLNFNVLSLKITDLSLETLGVESNEVLAVNLAFRLYKLPDESVTTENLRDELLRRVKGLFPAVVTVVEQEMNSNTAPFVARVTEVCGYYSALFDSVDATVSRETSERVRIEEGLSRKMSNSVACEGRDRVERCEVFGKWRARMGMAGFEPKPLSQHVADSLLARVNSGTRGNPGFTVKEENGGVWFGWMGRTLTVASAWR
ncbi:unnamed protein product [Camellia sinensis]